MLNKSLFSFCGGFFKKIEKQLSSLILMIRNNAQADSSLSKIKNSSESLSDVLWASNAVHIFFDNDGLLSRHSSG